MTTEQLFPELVETLPDAVPNQNVWPFFIVAYWPNGRYWSIKSDLTGEPSARAEKLISSGWKFVTILKLPPGPWGDA